MLLGTLYEAVRMSGGPSSKPPHRPCVHNLSGRHWTERHSTTQHAFGVIERDVDTGYQGLPCEADLYREERRTSNPLAPSNTIGRLLTVRERDVGHVPVFE